MNRHNARIIAVITLYNYDLTKLSKEEATKAVDNILQIEAEEDYPVEIDKEYAHHLVEITLNNIEQIDEIISSYLINYTIDRLSYVDRAIIRLAVGEMIEKSTPREVIINEALEITKEYSCVENDKQVKFSNRVLDNIAGGLYAK